MEYTLEPRPTGDGEPETFSGVRERVPTVADLDGCRIAFPHGLTVAHGVGPVVALARQRECRGFRLANVSDSVAPHPPRDEEVWS